LGLLLAGIVHIMISRRRIEKVAGEAGLKGVGLAAALGIPLPLCSCSVLQVTVELDKKGVSKPALMSFLISTPETGVDSIVITWVLLGPVFAIIRPVISFFTAVISGIFAIGLLPSEPSKSQLDRAEICQDKVCLDVSEEDEYIGFKPLLKSFYVSIKNFFRKLLNWPFLFTWYKPKEVLGDVKSRYETPIEEA